MEKWFWLMIGSTSVLAGLLVVWTPVPLGLPLFMVGIPLLMKYSPHSRNGILWLASHFPRLFQRMRRVIPFDKTEEDVPAASDKDSPYPQ
jgi:hypothetical protein